MADALMSLAAAALLLRSGKRKSVPGKEPCGMETHGKGSLSKDGSMENMQSQVRAARSN